jgi:hypothetical protein
VRPSSKGFRAKRLRRNEIKAGVITGSVGRGLMILLFVLMEGIIASGRVSDAAAAILSRIWIVGVIPLPVGAALIINGVFVGKNPDGLTTSGADIGSKELGDTVGHEFLPPADTNELAPTPFSVTDQTTKHLREPRRNT